MLATLAVIVLASSGPSATCLAAAHRFTAFLVEEARGTRHEKQIADSISAAGGMDAKARQIAAGMTADKCAFILAAPDSSVRSLAIATLPERAGK